MHTRLPQARPLRLISRLKRSFAQPYDAVLVVKDSVEYHVPEGVTVLDEGLPEAFLVSTGELLTGSGRLYKRATLNDSIEGMFSFFPAITAGGDSAFPRPCIDLPNEYIIPRSWQAPKGSGEAAPPRNCAGSGKPSSHKSAPKAWFQVRTPACRNVGRQSKQ